MKQLIAVVAVIILGIAVGGIIVGFSSTADNIGTQADALVVSSQKTDSGWALSVGLIHEAENPGEPETHFPWGLRA